MSFDNSCDFCPYDDSDRCLWCPANPDFGTLPIPDPGPLLPFESDNPEDILF